jgi:hypothetical protein
MKRGLDWVFLCVGCGIPLRTLQGKILFFGAAAAIKILNRKGRKEISQRSQNSPNLWGLSDSITRLRRARVDIAAWVRQNTRFALNRDQNLEN